MTKRHTATVSSRGQIVLPREVRDRLGVQKGDEVEFVLDEAGIHVLPKREDDNPFTAWLGAQVSGERTEDFERDTRHAGMSTQELEVLRSGPGANVTYLPLPESAARPATAPKDDA
ncbi:AbrB/MazE/SpoVT family DNA-binding domain-containing protein [Deinococcus altitudinis]|uniref:AbrB/MazE/SpoVT family DNA-binding domain-containing protein n=1 Tax=Deinococcus altitudinis TaxID=468914 RepID=UPI0038922239